VPVYQTTRYEIAEYSNLLDKNRAPGGAFGCGTGLQAGRSWVLIPNGVTGIFIDIIFTATLWP